ncbi:trichohyalin-like [Papaver somniferum]|uniref:trichohyalin-like n=1 Tax=Papaver somniferum TaxID=3469 RepID=UPI000E6FBD14|nr:trichohyalin-like [Papaver somniferum]
MEVIEENMQEDDNSQDQQRRRDIVQDLGTNRYEHPREILRRTHNDFAREEEDWRQMKMQMILHGREMLKEENEREREVTNARNERDKQRRREDIEERELQEALRQNNYDNRVRRREHHRMNDTEQGRVSPQEIEMSRHRHDGTGEEERHDKTQIETHTDKRWRRREEAEEYVIQEAIHQNNHENRLRQARLKRPMPEDIYQSFSEDILKEMAELREMMTAKRNGGKRKLEEAVEEAGKTPFTKKIQREMIPSKCNYQLLLAYLMEAPVRYNM